jgi:hypothetical protein
VHAAGAITVICVTPTTFHAAGFCIAAEPLVVEAPGTDAEAPVAAKKLQLALKTTHAAAIGVVGTA